MSDPLAVSLSVRLYRTLLLTYPRHFRMEYGESMVQVFRDLCIHGEEGGLIGVWGHALLDYAVSLVSEHMQRGVEMTKSKWIQLSGWGLAASGFLLLAGFAAASRPDYSPYNSAAWPIDPLLNKVGTILITAAMLLISAGLMGLLARFERRASDLSRIGLVFGSLGGSVSAVGAFGLGLFKNGPWWEMFMIGLLAASLGLTLFGVDCLRQRLFARWNGMPLVIGVSSLALGLSMSLIHMEWPSIVEFIALLTFAFGLGLVGYRLQSEAVENPAAAPA
jgi:hypothetical protein